MGEGGGVGDRVESAPILGRVRRGDTGRQVHRHEHGLVVERRRGAELVLPYATTEVHTTAPPIPMGPRHRIPDHRETWRFRGADGSWSTGWVRREASSAVLCAAAAEASVPVRLAVARDVLARGGTVAGHLTHVRLRATGVEVDGALVPWSAVRGTTVERGILHLALADRTVVVGEGIDEVPDAAVVVALVEERATG